jgi:prepilin-type N-terminal cleavage/methylation domain-containing protein/prepilin-type processing-associated H-X9-DG protein
MKIFEAHWRRRKSLAFTLIELLVVVLIIAILASLLLPALAGAKVRAHKINCVSNLKQLQVAYQMYADDFRDLIVPNQKGSVDSETTNSWVEGLMNGGYSAANNTLANPTDPTNTELLKQCLLYPYCQSTKIYKCPADVLPNPQTVLGGGPLIACRSYAMNCYMNGFDVTSDTGDFNFPAGQPPAGFYAVQTKLSQVQSPLPANRIVFVDESRGSIDDGMYATPPEGAQYGPFQFWLNHPTARHANGAVFSYADGHALAQAWLGTQLQQWDATSAIGNDGKNDTMIGPDLSDLQWVQARIALPSGEN